MALKRHFNVNLDIFYWTKGETIAHPAQKEDGLELRKSQAFENEITVKLNIKHLKYFKVSGNYVIVVSDRLDVYSKHVKLIKSIDVNYATSQVSLALDLFERFVGYSTDSTLVLKKDGIQGVVNFVLNEIYESAVANDIISKEQGWVIIKDLKKDGDLAHWRAHNSQVLKFSFSSSGQKVLTCTFGSNSFHIWDLVNIKDKQPDLIFVLSRGYTPASVYDISWTIDDSWVSVSTSHGTSHLYFLNPTDLQSFEVKKLSPKTRIRRRLDEDRRDFLAFRTDFVYPLQILDDGARLSFITVLSNDSQTLHNLEITGSLYSVEKVTVGDPERVLLENGEGLTDFSDLSTYLKKSNIGNSSLNSWHSLVSIESYQFQPFWSVNHVSFSTFEESVPSYPYQKNSPDLSDFPGTRPFSMIESVALPNGKTSSQFPAVNWKEDQSDSLVGAIELELDKNAALVMNPRVDRKRRNDVSFDDEWTVQVEGVQMEDVL